MPTAAPDPRDRWRQTLRLTGALLALWFVVTFCIAWFASDLTFSAFGWPFSFWVAAQGAPIVYVLVIVCYAWAMERLEGDAT